jgi:DNA-binding LacI/PurR family transcriptional regulator
MKAAAELKYHPNLHARTLAGGRSRTIGMIVSNTVHIPRQEIGHVAFECLVPGRNSPRIPGRDIVIDPEFVVRQSTGPAKKK